MSAAPSPKSRRLPWSKTTIIVFAFLALTIVPAFIAFAMTPQDARVVTSVQGWNGCAYTVRRGENLFRIGVRYGVTYHYLAQLNGIDNPNYVWAGQVLSVPCGPVPRVAYGADARPIYQKEAWPCPWSGSSSWSWCQPAEIPSDCTNSISHNVVAGDNLFRIAVNNGSTIPWIRTQNNLWGQVLRPGMTIEVPCAGRVTYGPNVATPTPGGPNIITETPSVMTVVPPTAIPSRIRMNGGQFRPATLTVKSGTTVTWVNNEASDGPAYSITSGVSGTPNGLFDSGLIQPGSTFQFTFTTPGSYAYYSTTNPTGMTAEIIVTP